MCGDGRNGFMNKFRGKNWRFKLAEVEEGMVVGDCRGSCRNKEGDEKSTYHFVENLAYIVLSIEVL